MIQPITTPSHPLSSANIKYGYRPDPIQLDSHSQGHQNSSMSQYWRLISLDKRSSTFLGQLGDVFFGTNWSPPALLALNLAIPAFQAFPPLKNGRTRAAEWVVGVDSPLGRLQLAIELIIMIFQEIDNVYDAIMLGLTHDTLMVIGWEHIQALLVRDSAMWAGTRIICAGHYGKDTPEGVIPEEEQEEWDRLCLEQEGRELETLNLHEIFAWLSDDSMERTIEEAQRCRKLLPEETRLFHTITDEGYQRYQWEKGWVLMNETKEEYVTSMAASRILPSMKATDPCYFGQLILSRICWSSTPWTDLNFTGDLHRGVWAGDRFIIVIVDVFDAMPSVKGWKDVSVEAAEWLRDILLAGRD